MKGSLFSRILHRFYRISGFYPRFSWLSNRFRAGLCAVLLMVCVPVTANNAEHWLRQGQTFMAQGDDKAAFERYRQAAEQGNADALFLTGVARIRGVGTDKDQVQGLKDIEQAAAKGQKVGQFTLGYLYKKGLTGKVDYQQAVHWFRLAAEQGLALAQVAMGTHRAQGLGIAEDPDEAQRWFRKAYAQGNNLAGYNLAILMLKQDRSERQRGLNILHRTAEAGHILSQTTLSGLYREGRYGMSKDTDKMLFWLEKAAKQNHVLAQLSLGSVYLSGKHIPVNGKKAVFWLEQAGLRNHVMAQLALGSSYVKGTAVKRNLAEAYSWFSLAALTGHEKAAELRDQLAVRLTAQQLTQAQKATKKRFDVIQKSSGKQSDTLDFLNDEESLLRL